jgi:membrane protease YdiL (CAAX protease family)
VTTTNEAPRATPGATKRKYVIGISLVWIGELLVRDVFLPSEPNNTYVAIAVSVEWLCVALFALYWIPKVEGATMHSVGLTRFRWRYLWVGGVAFLAQLVVTIAVGGALHAARLGTLQDLQPMIKAFSPLTRAILFTAGTMEEFFYRGYLIERLTSLIGRRWPALLLSWLSFTLVHLKFFGVGPTLQVSVLAASLVWVYWKERSLWPCLVIHGINSLFAYVLFPALV